MRGWPHLQLLVSAVAAALVVFAAVYPPYLRTAGPKQSLAVSLVIVIVGAVYLAVGIGAWHERPHNRVGPLMVAVGFGWLLFQLSWLPGTVPLMLSYVTDQLELPFLVWLALVYPTGRFWHRLEWIVVALAWILWAWGRTLIVLTDDPRTYCPRCPRNVLLMNPDPGLQRSLGRLDGFATLLLVGVVVALLLWHWWRSTGYGRRKVLPLAWLYGPPVAWEVYLQGAQLALWPFEPRLYPWFNLALVTVPLGYVSGRVRDALARGDIGELIVGFRSPGKKGELGPAAARTRRDPSLVVAYWIPEKGHFADLDGRQVAVPRPGHPLRAATMLERDGEPLAMITHGAAVGDRPKLMAAATAAVSMALENQLLHALVRAQINDVRASGARVVMAPDDEGRRLERDRYDGAQQGLLTLALAVDEARTHSDMAAEPSVTAALDAAATELGTALAERR